MASLLSLGVLQEQMQAVKLKFQDLMQLRLVVCQLVFQQSCHMRALQRAQAVCLGQRPVPALQLVLPFLLGQVPWTEASEGRLAALPLVLHLQHMQSAISPITVAQLKFHVEAIVRCNTELQG